MSSILHLWPLSGYQSSATADINAAGHIVGTSFEKKLTPPNWMPLSKATRWVGGQPLYLRMGAAGYHPYNFQSSKALRVNAAGDVLCVSGGKSYYVWRDQGQPAIDLKAVIPGLIDAIDLNDAGQLLATVEPLKAVIYTLGGGTQPLPLLQDFSPYPSGFVGIDNSGRVLATHVLPGPYLGWGGPPKNVIQVWKPGVSSWTTHPQASYYKPRLTKAGEVLGNFSENQPFRINLTTSGAAPALPMPPLASGYACEYTDGSEGRYVGTQYFIDGTRTAFMYDSTGSGIANLAGDFAMSWIPWSHLTSAGVEKQRIVGSGTTFGGKTRGWMLNLAPQFNIEGADFEQFAGPESDDIHEYLEQTLSGVPGDELLRELVQGMAPTERARAVTRSGELAARISRMTGALRGDGDRADRPADGNAPAVGLSAAAAAELTRS